MSQITHVGGGGPGPIGGVQTLSGNGGAKVSPDGSGNIDLIGTGGITVVSDDATHSLTINGPGTALIFHTSDNNDSSAAANVINIVQGANILTTSVPNNGNNVGIAVTPSVNLAGSLTAGTFVQATGDIISTTGDVVSSNGDITAPNGNMIANGARITGKPNGALVTNGTGGVFAINGTIDQVLMAFPGHEPEFGSIVGAGGTTVNVDTQGTITVSSPVVPGAVTVAGTANQITVAGGPAYLLSLPAAVIAPGSLTTTGALTSNTTLTTTGINTLDNLPVNGVVQTNAEHQLIASNGANGTLLIGTGVGNAPVWNTLTAGTNINITNTAGHVKIDSTAGASFSSFFAYQLADTGYITANGTTVYAYMGAAVPMSIAAPGFNTGTNFYVGGGTLGTPATYTAQATGTYYFYMKLNIYATISSGAIGNPTIWWMDIYNATQNIHYQKLAYGWGGLIYNLRVEAIDDHSVYTQLNAGDVVKFGLLYPGYYAPGFVGVLGPTLANNNFTGYQSYICGHKVA